MEIPGLTRLKSPSQDDSAPAQLNNNDSTSTQFQSMPVLQTPKVDPAPSHIDAGLAAKIEAMRAQIRSKSSVQEPAESVVNVSPPAASTSSVNYSILDKALASHGFETMPDSDEEMQADEGVANESSDSDDSSDISSDSDDESDASMEDTPLTAEERERILIAADNDGPISNEVPRTKNEIAEDEEPVRVPEFEIDASEVIEFLGTITSIVGSACVVTGTPSPETKVLDVGSLLVFEDRKNLGYIADTFGPVILPMFTVRFTDVEALNAAGVAAGKKIYVVPKHAQYVFSDTLKVQGTDASNINDEEQSETEFSDDEKEAMYKSQKKHQKKAEKQGHNGHHEPRPLNDLESIAMAQGLTYDPSQNRVHIQQSTQFHGSPSRSPAGPQQASRGRGANRGQRNTRGRPENNNYGRGPDYAGSNLSQSYGAMPPQPYQRAYYQPESVQSPAAQSTRATNDPAASLQQPQQYSAAPPTLYQPLKRPS
ncbi:putative SnoRNP assembly factor Naf1 [Taphrina deformans PYCC 5710]|uniref:H/ACA ribonucleoprotein complex non-core subunit NAF1 n=1 Tax=Taphrina deformans (strain PYCC 5710 / ATCC 11124 / CBS 356.35 / IMI 108563 / JCM 9778 / NBRC 8474) TaxID=1097556 RepID=R4XCD1_TAPDE|nr:putative SnoRNP assembly factor Naf1 [Taphrina deformans PYCC 5710]|eukprot:CCG83527.1 putative SnoRNP assembly factor Naf1 [Taphrina deformans PYCC 5710]